MNDYIIVRGVHMIQVLEVVADLQDNLSGYVVKVCDEMGRQVLLDFVDSLEAGRKMAITFDQCYSEAESLGYALEHDHFVTPNGSRVHVTEAIGSDLQTINRFRRELQRAANVPRSRQ